MEVADDAPLPLSAPVLPQQGHASYNYGAVTDIRMLTWMLTIKPTASCVQIQPLSCHVILAFNLEGFRTLTQKITDKLF